MIQDYGSNVSVSSTDICETEDPCQNGGICITTDSGPVCDCRNIEYEGTFCEKGTFPHDSFLPFLYVVVLLYEVNTAIASYCDIYTWYIAHLGIVYLYDGISNTRTITT